MADTQDFAGRVAVVTGASRGIGYQLAKELGKRGAHVFALAKTVGGLEDLDDEIRAAGGTATLVPVDVTDFDALDRLGAAIFERFKKLDILVGNAGILGTLAPTGHIKPKDFEKVMATNVTANFRLIRSLDPLLRQSEAGRAVFMTSAQARDRVPFWGLQAASKAALDAMVVTYAHEMEKAPLRVNLYDPGPVRTGLRAKAMPGEKPESLTQPEEVVPDILKLLSPELAETGLCYRRESGSFEAV
ncbi:SDR family NAD(P)-dependent oxidoreductase [Roseibium sp. CAU 1637]|uniref:SDR family NAD(P)-dependent oxidoreductase n=1 Tax=Roseibium limicola TaxID=2816037 RepID=A0A939ES80_9HYPH|nr:SDR family NAD(P)-dependent oxidoreductase [Roseibium limicola]MBO0346159.1 SDR family NAD(P)-dependent oxidoreductase [Roseibium limicola]